MTLTAPFVTKAKITVPVVSMDTAPMQGIAILALSLTVLNVP
jgi:hypothetical protein